ncbi:signal peptide peptidase SppA [Dysgonomonas sp. HGC4]|uniref:signal peptide peptidase SppA n=1 Tax=Dysgonomonas sp. HGC4 TaxID=1658009 RepID=UPI0006823A39|nr:signal peptide peptidase SppA [Dysgonomonas sp. HGC4]MBD8349892.1 signal peptide peptidase SppA [Dysgonomonas sp. HGC4]
MKDFFKSVLASIVGIFISSFIIGGVLVLLFFGFIGVLLSSSSDTFVLKNNSVLTIRLTGVMKDRVLENPIIEFFNLGEAKEMALTDILSAIKKAKENDDIKGIYISSGYFMASSASLTEIRDQLSDFKESGKFIIAYADDYMQGGYFLSTVADKVIMNPQGSLNLQGLSANPTFYKGLLDKIGVEMQIFKVGTYKSAVEPFILDKMSDASKEQVGSYMNDIWSTILGKVSESRGISVERLNQLTDTLPAFQEGEFSVKNHLVDTLMYESEVRQYLKTLLGVDDSKNLNVASVADMVTVKDIKKSKSTDQIAILYAEGSIVSGTKPTDINDKYLIKEIEKLQDDDNIKAVVFRVNSPGGSAYASEQIWKAVTDLKAKKPIVVSMGDYAASGGYYISSNASKIYAQPTTLTGSIGIFGMFPNVAGLTNKVGLSFDNVKTNKFSDYGDITRPMSEQEKAILQQYIERGYNLFLSRCSEGRNIPRETLEKIAEGRVWTGKQALEIGLVDAIGGLDDALKEAAKLANVSDFSIREYPKQVSPFEALFKTQTEDIATRALKEYLGSDFLLLKTIKDIKDLKEQDFIQARMPYSLQLN